MLKKIGKWLKKNVWVKIVIPPLIPEKDEMLATFKVDLLLMDVDNKMEKIVRAGVYPLFRVPSPYLELQKDPKKAEPWLVIKGDRVGAIESCWKDWVLCGQVEIE